MRSSEHLKPMALLPNQAGYKFIGLTIEDQEVECEVICCEDGIHRVKGVPFLSLQGWYKKRE